MFHTRAGRFLLPRLPSALLNPSAARVALHRHNTTTHRSHKHHTPFVGSSSMEGFARKRPRHTTNKAEAGLRALVLIVEVLEEL